MSNCNCKPYCDTHGRDYVGNTENGTEYCLECAADGYNSQLCGTWPDASSSSNGTPDATDLFEMKFMCPIHKEQKLQTIKELAD